MINLIFIALSAFLWRAGGAGKRWLRRYVLPLTLFGFAVFYDSSLIGILKAGTAAGILLGSQHLPITLIGSDVIPKNIWWVPILGIITYLSAGVLALPNWALGLTLTLMFGIYYGVLAASAEFWRLKQGVDVWDIFEVSAGLSFGIACCIALNA